MNWSLTALMFVSVTANSAVVTDGVWNPARTETGGLDPADVAMLPENQWVAVNGATYRQLRREIVTAFNATHGTDYAWNGKNGQGSIDVTTGGQVFAAINAWSSGYFDSKRNQICNAATGGNTAGGVTGTWCWDISAAKWVVPDAPDNPDDPRWCDAYRKTYSTTNFPIACLAEAGWSHENISAYPLDDRLPNGTPPNGKPAARHWYGTQDFDPVTDRVFGARVGVWTQNKATGEWKVVAVKRQDNPAVKIMAAAVFNPYRGGICGLLPLKDGDYFGWRCIDPATGEPSSFPAMIKDNCKDRGCTVRNIPNTNEIIAFSGNEQSTGEVYSVYDVKKNLFIEKDKGVTGDVYQYKYQNEIPAMTFVPTWLGEDGKRGLWVRINTQLIDGRRCVWSIFNHRTGVQWQYKPEKKPSCSPFVGNKLVYSDAFGGNGVLVLMSANSDTSKAIWYMRLGDKAPAYLGDAAPVEVIKTNLQALIDSAETVKLAPGIYAGGVRFDGPKDIDFAGTEVAGGLAVGFNGQIEPRGSSPIILRNLTIIDPNYAAIWAIGTPRMLIENLTVSNSKHPLLTPNEGGEVYIYRARIADSVASKPGFQHPIYIGQIDWFESTGVHVYGHKALGHLFKSRARVSILRDFLLDGGTTRHSRGVDISCGGTLVLDGGTIAQSPNADNDEILAIGPEADRTATGQSCERNGVGASMVVLRNVKFVRGRPNAVIYRNYNTHKTRWVCLEGNDWGGMTPPPCDADTNYMIPSNPFGDDNSLRAQYLAMAGKALIDR